MSKKIRLTKRQKQILEQERKQEELEKELLSRRPTIHEAAEVQYFKIQRRIEYRLKKIDEVGRAVRSNYLNPKQKKKALEALKNHILLSRELLRRCYGLHTIYVRKLMEKLIGTQK